MKYIRTKSGIYDLDKSIWYEFTGHKVKTPYCEEYEKQPELCKSADAIEELCDCFIKIKRKGDRKQYILKFDHKDLPTLKEKAIKCKDSPVYGAIHVEGKGLVYAAKMNEKGEFESLC